MSQTSIMLNRILASTVKRGAAYLHLEIGAKPVMRMANKLIPLDEEQVVNKEFLGEVVKIILSEDQQKELEERKSIIIVRTFEGEMRFKMHVFFQKENLAILFNYIPPEIKSPEEMGLTKEFINLTNKKKGLIVIGGLHGSGKTATAVSLLNFINHTQSKYILTLERPIEYILNPRKSIVEQREIGRDAHSFSKSVKFAQEGDVDVVFLSDLDNYELLNRVINLIDSGRLVIVVIEADSAPEAVEKIVELAPKQESEKIRNIIADLLLGVGVQRLLPRRGGDQIIATEILITNSAAKSLIKEGKFGQIVSIMQTSKKEGMKTLDLSLIELVRTGEVNFEDALPMAVDKIDFQAAAQNQ